MNLAVPLGSASSIGRKRPYKIGASSDAEAAQSLYPYIILTMRKPRREILALADRLGYLCPFSIPSESSPDPCRQCGSAAAWCRGSRGGRRQDRGLGERVHRRP